MTAEQPLELILARNLISIVAVAAFLTDADGRMVFFNDAAGELMGASFEEIGVLEQSEWIARYGPFDPNGRVLAADELPLATAVREARPAYGHFSVRAAAGMIEIEAAALPLVGPAGYHGALVVFWPLPPRERG